MARPKKTRIVCRVPQTAEFNSNGGDTVNMTVDEYEALRLIDYMELTQKECSRQMRVARTTVTAVYESAKYKMSDSIVNNKAIKIDGGDYQLCSNSEFCCGHCGQSRCGKCNHGKCDLCTGIFHEKGRECYQF